MTNLFTAPNRRSRTPRHTLVSMKDLQIVLFFSRDTLFARARSSVDRAADF